MFLLFQCDVDWIDRCGKRDSAGYAGWEAACFRSAVSGVHSLAELFHAVADMPCVVHKSWGDINTTPRTGRVALGESAPRGTL